MAERERGQELAAPGSLGNVPEISIDSVPSEVDLEPASSVLPTLPSDSDDREIAFTDNLATKWPRSREDSSTFKRIAKARLEVARAELAFLEAEALSDDAATSAPPGSADDFRDKPVMADAATRAAFSGWQGASETYAPRDSTARIRDTETYPLDGVRSSDSGRAETSRSGQQAVRTHTDLATALMEVARGGLPANRRCLRSRGWQHRCKSKPCAARGCKYFHHWLLHGDTRTTPPVIESETAAACDAGTASRAGARCCRARDDDVCGEPGRRARDDGARGAPCYRARDDDARGAPCRRARDDGARGAPCYRARDDDVCGEPGRRARDDGARGALCYRARDDDARGAPCRRARDDGARGARCCRARDDDVCGEPGRRARDDGARGAPCCQARDDDARGAPCCRARDDSVPCGWARDAPDSEERCSELENDHQRPAAVTSARAPQAHRRTLLKVMPVKIAGIHGEIDAYALLDDGSTVTLVTEEIAHRVGATGPHDPFYIEAVGGARINASHSRRVSLTIRGKYSNNNVKIKARTIDALDISPQSVSVKDIASCGHLDAIADQVIYDDGKPSLLIGQDNWEILLTSQVRKGRSDQLVASCTPLGWVLHGQSERFGKGNRAFASLHRCAHLRTGSDSSMEQLMREYFDLESLGIESRRPQNDPDTKALKILKETTRSLPGGGYETGLLWKNDSETLPNNYQAALGRLQGLEKRLNKDPQLKVRYLGQMDRMLKQGYAEVAPSAVPGGVLWYLPHFPVLNPSKPGKVRVVHDAAARTNGVSLNDHLLVGPSLLQSLLGVLSRFRQKSIAIVADIKDMFLRIQIRAQDRDALRFLWRESESLEPMEYRMTSLPFGASSSPATAIYVKNYNAHLNKDEYPEAVSAIVNNHYMDDYLQSFDTIEEAARTARAVDAVHRKGNFELQRWASNCSAAIADFTTVADVPAVSLHNEEKVLGLVWCPTDDTLGFDLSRIIQLKNIFPTKREVLKVTMSLFDPIGLLAPVTCDAKRILRQAWKLGLGWDEPLPTDLTNRWNNWLTLLNHVKDLRIPRCHPGYSTAAKLELHTFVDASETTYSAAVYWRMVDNNESTQVSLAAAKGRIATLKVTSIPRLELQGALMGSRLALAVQEEHDRRPDRRVFWTDSRTVLAWLRAGARSFKPYVAHRLAELEDNTDGNEWRWCPSGLNVSDDCTRNTPPDFSATHRWFCGPRFLYDNEEAWPVQPEPLHTQLTGEERVTTTTNVPRLSLVHSLPDATRFSSWLRLIRATARVLQFIDVCRRDACTVMKRTRRVTDDDKTWKPTARGDTRRASGRRIRTCGSPSPYVPLPTEYTRRAEHLWVRATQEEKFPDELRDVTGGRALAPTSRLRHLSLIVADGTLQLRSRISAAEGITEQMVATVKRAMLATLNERHPHKDTLHTLLTEIEHTINSRPLTHVSVAAEDEEALTPNHFLLGGPSKVPLPGTFSKVDELGRSHWRASQRLADLFWQRWMREALPLLQYRRQPAGRGEQIKVGDIVIVVDPNLPRNVWPKGRVKAVYPGKDGVVRVVDIVMKNGTIWKRPTKRLVVLPLD